MIRRADDAAREVPEKQAVWNTLHDGGIHSIAGVLPGDVNVRVRIPYLCAKLPTASDYVTVHLAACTRFVFGPFEGQAVEGLAAIAGLHLEVLSAGRVGDTVSVA